MNLIDVMMWVLVGILGAIAVVIWYVVVKLWLSKRGKYDRRAAARSWSRWKGGK